MIQLENKELSQTTLDSLAQYQESIDNQANFNSKVAEAKRIWPSRRQNAPFNEIKEKLTEMCSGARRCCYCEDSVADEIEHIYPKNHYPELTFVWENYLYACGPCNGPKNDHFAIFSNSGEVIHLNSNASLTLSQPYLEDSVLINPRKEDPLDFIFLDIVDTFHFVELADNPNTSEFKRAKYTIEVLRLNARDYLAQSRKSAYEDYRARLREYIFVKSTSTNQDRLNRMKEGILRKSFPTVWAEMKRWHGQIPELKELFDEAPEALTW